MHLIQGKIWSSRYCYQLTLTFTLFTPLVKIQYTEA